MADLNLIKCACGIFFVTRAAAEQHRCNMKDNSNLTSYELTDNSRTMMQCDECKSFFDDLQLFQRHECVVSQRQEQELATEPSGTGMVNSKTISNTFWGSPETKLLISLYKTCENAVNKGKMRKKTLWDTISTDLAKHGYRFTPEQVAGRWKSLMRAYKAVKDNNKKSGMGSKTYEYESELDDIFEKDPIMTPQFTMSSSERKRRVCDDECFEGQSSEESGSSKVSVTKKVRSTNTSSNKEVVEVFKSFVEDQKEDWKRRQEMHKEKMEVMGSLINVLKDMK